MYESIKTEIPKNIGCYVVYDNGLCKCIKNASKIDISKEWSKDLMFALMQSLSREYSKLFIGSKW